MGGGWIEGRGVNVDHLAQVDGHEPSESGNTGLFWLITSHVTQTTRSDWSVLKAVNSMIEASLPFVCGCVVVGFSSSCDTGEDRISPYQPGKLFWLRSKR